MSTGSGIEPIILTVSSAARPAAAWRAVTDPAQVSRWFADASPLGEVGSRYAIDFGDGSQIDGAVVDLDPGRRFAHTWHWAGDEPVAVTRVAWDVESGVGGGSRITLQHDGWTEAAGGSTARDDHAGYWRDYLDGLAALLEAEPGRPGQDDPEPA